MLCADGAPGRLARDQRRASCGKVDTGFPQERCDNKRAGAPGVTRRSRTVLEGPSDGPDAPESSGRGDPSHPPSTARGDARAGQVCAAPGPVWRVQAGAGRSRARQSGLLADRHHRYARRHHPGPAGACGPRLRPPAPEGPPRHPASGPRPDERTGRGCRSRRHSRTTAKAGLQQRPDCSKSRTAAKTARRGAGGRSSR